MAGNKAGGIKTRNTNLEKYGADFYLKIGAIGGSAKVPKGFAINKELASEAGRRGGLKSRRTK